MYVRPARRYLTKPHLTTKHFSFYQTVTQEWYLKFICDLSEKEAYKTLLAANFLHIQPLLDLVVLRIAKLFSGKTPAEVSRYLYIRVSEDNDFLIFFCFSIFVRILLVEGIAQVPGADNGTRKEGPRGPPLDF